MTRKFLVFSLLISLALSSYLPMSMKKHNFGDHICRYYDYDEQIDYVRPCEANKYCQKTETSSTSATVQNNLHTCQNYVVIDPNPTTPLKKIEENCQKDSECMKGLVCSSNNKCSKTCNTDEEPYLVDNKYECRYVGDKCRYKKGGFTITYHTRNCKVCGKIDLTDQNYGDNKSYKVLNFAEENDYYSQKDGTYVINREACESSTALYFYGDGNIKNVVDDVTEQSNNKMYLRCVTIKEVDIHSGRVKYTINTDEVKVYDIYEVEFDDRDTTNAKKSEMKSFFDSHLMTKIELFNENKENFIKKYRCDADFKLDDNLKRKIYYFENIEEYLLYKDQTEVIEYLIQDEYPDIVPIITSKDSAGFLRFKYLILSLMLLFL